jgi:hypothetical protein
MRFPLVLVLAALVAPGALPAQSVRGQLTDSITRVRLPGAFLTLVDERGVEQARTMTNGAGEFLLTAPAAGVYRLRSKRIGFRPHFSPALTLRAGETIAYTAAVDPIPVALQEVVVAGDRQCDIEAGASVAALWDEVREALGAVSWTSRVPGYWFETTVFERDASPSGRPRGRDSVRHEIGYQKIAFRNYATNAELETQGYVIVTDTGWIYRAPDADVLLSATFLRTHCFETRAGRGETAGLIGLMFTSARDRTAPDISGTMWVDGKTSELRWMDFNYVRLPQDVVSSRAGGHIEFMRLPSGVWIVRDWVIRMPYAQMKQRPMAMGTELQVIGFREKGGSADLIKARDGTIVYGTAPAAPPATTVATAPPVPLAAPPETTSTAPTADSASLPPPQAPARTASVARRRNPNLIEQPEIEGSTALDAYALIQEARPNWLHSRGPISIRDPNAGVLQVYLNGSQFGDVNKLREIQRREIRELRFYSAADAQMRFGLGHGGGVIDVSTGVIAPTAPIAAEPPPPADPAEATPSPTAPPPPAPASDSAGARAKRARARNAEVLAAEEFEGSTAIDVMALVQEFRPNWLHSRGVVSIRDQSAGDVRVYLNGVATGGVNRLREIRADDVRELRHLGAAEAQQRYGLGHGGGVIEVWTR